MTQDFSKKVLDRVDYNTFMLNQWVDVIVTSLMREYDQLQYVKPFFNCLFRTTDNSYETYSVRDFEISDKGRRFLQTFNFYFKVPLMGCFTAFMVEAQNNEGQTKSALLTIIEDPIITMRKIYLEHEVDGQKKLIHDAYMTKFTDFPPEISDFRFIIETGTKSNIVN